MRNVDERDMTKQALNKIPTGIAVGSVIAFFTIGFIYKIWNETNDDIEHKISDKSKRKQRISNIESKRDELFHKILG